LRSVLLRGFLSEEKAARFPSIRRYLMMDDAPRTARTVDWVMGSCLFLRGDALRDTGGFDEKFFMYYEDIDLCHRLGRAGWSVEYFPDVEWIHDYRRQSARRGQGWLRLIHFQSALRFLLRRARADGWPSAF
jgi:N-acetylglucosaminyl-diphospho-decaprenol L-rhamnosyltransferase